MEYLDVLDKFGEKTGNVKPRDIVHRDGDWHRTVLVWIMNSQKEVLLQKRSPTRKKYPNMWHISVAGHVSAGADNVATAIKEVKEELGLDVQISDIRFLFSVLKSSKPSQELVENEFCDVFLIKMDVAVEQIKVNPDEVADARFFAWDEYKNMVKEKNAGLIVPAYIEKLIEVIDNI